LKLHVNLCGGESEKVKLAKNKRKARKKGAKKDAGKNARVG
jgi:hypothetical protein